MAVGISCTGSHGIRYEGNVHFFATHDDKIGNVIDVVVLMIQFLLFELVLDLSKQKAVQQRNVDKAGCEVGTVTSILHVAHVCATNASRTATHEWNLGLCRCGLDPGHPKAHHLIPRRIMLVA